MFQKAKSIAEENDEYKFELKRKRMIEYCNEHFCRDFVREMESKNFLIDAPQPHNEEDFKDIDQMFDEAEKSGVCTDEEVRMMFAV